MLVILITGKETEADSGKVTEGHGIKYVEEQGLFPGHSH